MNAYQFALAHGAPDDVLADLSLSLYYGCAGNHNYVPVRYGGLAGMECTKCLCWRARWE